MMIKVTQNTFNFQDRTITRLTGRPCLVKSAAHPQIQTYITGLKPASNVTRFHVLFLGAGEFYSSNKNGDWFGEEDLVAKHKTFEEYGHVFRHHVNKDPAKKYGDIDLSIYNQDMHRVEGIISLDNDQNQDVLERYENGEDIPVSMAAKLRYDVCSICQKRSTKIEEYCDHLKFEMNSILPDGRKVYAINPNPIFFDISIVYRPADPTAYFFDKVASNNSGVVLSAQVGRDLYGLPGVEKFAMTEKMATIRKLAEIEKHVESILSGKVEGDSLEPLLNAKYHVRDFPHSALSRLKCLPLDNVLPSLTKLKIMLTLKEFLDLFDKADMHDEVEPKLPGCFQRLLDCDNDDLLGFDFRLGGQNYMPIFDIIRRFARDRVMGKDYFDGKTISINFGGKPKVRHFSGPGMRGFSMSHGSGNITIKSSAVKNSVADNLASLYNLYKAAFCMENKNRATYLYSVLSNY